MEMNYASNGKANAALTTGIIGTALGAINTLGANGGLNGVLGGLVGNPASAASVATTAGLTDNAIGMLAGAAIAQAIPRNNCACINEDHTVNRYEMNTQFGYTATIQQKDLELARKDSELALAHAKENTRQEIISVYEQVKKEMNEQNAQNMAQFAAINQQLGAQAVQNQANKDSFQIIQERMDNRYTELKCDITREQETRKANDNLLVTYVNSTFYPNQIAPLTVDTTKAATPAHTYNPLPACTCNC